METLASEKPAEAVRSLIDAHHKVTCARADKNRHPYMFFIFVFYSCLELQETLDVSPGDYVSSDGGSGFQLMKIGEEGEGERGEKPREEEKKERVKEVKKKSRKYRGATEEILGLAMALCVCVCVY